MNALRFVCFGVLLILASAWAAPQAWSGDEGAVDALIGQLDRAVGPVRDELTSAIVAHGAEAVPALERGLMHWDPGRRQTCALILGRIGHAAQEARDALLEGLIDDSHAVRSACFVALGRSNPWDRMLAMRINAHVAAESEPSVRRAALHGLMLLGPESASFIAVRVKQPREREGVLDAIRTLGAEALPVLERLLTDPSWHVRAWTVRSALEIKAMPPAWPQALARMLDDESGAVRVAAARMLAFLAREDLRVVPLLPEHLANDEVQVRRILSHTLACAEPPPATGIAALLAALGDADAPVRTNAAWALGQFTDPGPNVLAAWKTALDDPVASVRISAARGLVRGGETPPAALSTLAEAARRLGARPPFTIRRRGLGGGRKKFGSTISQSSVVKDLVAVGERAVPALAAELNRTEREYGKLYLAYTLGHMGPAAAPPLETLLAEKDERLALAAACCLARFGERGAKAIPVLLRAMVDPEEPVIHGVAGGDEVIDALVAIGPSAVPALQKKRAEREDLALVIDGILEQIREKHAGK